MEPISGHIANGSVVGKPWGLPTITAVNEYCKGPREICGQHSLERCMLWKVVSYLQWSK